MRVVTRRLLVVLVGALVVAGCRLETATAPMGSRTFETRFDDVQELALGHTVRISDVVVGTVTAIELDGYRARVEYSIVDGRLIPPGTSAAIGATSLLGENYVQLRLPTPMSGEDLPDGAELPSAGTVTTVEELAVQLLALTRAIQGRDLSTIVEAGATAIGPRGAQLNAFIVSLDELSGGLAAQTGVFDALLTDLEVLLGALAPTAANIGATVDAAAAASETLAAQRTRLVDTVDALTVLASTLDAEVLVPHRDRLSGIIRDLAPVTDELVAERERLRLILERVVIATERIPSAIFQEGLLGYGWVHNFFFGETHLDFSEDQPVRSLPQILLPEEVRGS